MLKPVVDSVIEKAPSRYALVIGVAKRARDIVEKARAAEEILVEKPVGIAVEQLMAHQYEIVELTDEEIAAANAAKAAALAAEAEAAAAAAEKAEEDEDDEDDEDFEDESDEAEDASEEE